LILILLASGCEVADRPTVQPELQPRKERAERSPVLYSIAQDDEALLNELQHRIFKYFWNEVYPETGIAVDHSRNPVGKVASTGFELAAVCIGIEREWVTYDEGYARVEKILNAFYDDPDDPEDGYVDGQFGLYWHFIDGRTGKMKPIDCVAMCDSADFIAGVVLVEQYFKDTPLEELARKLYDQVQWDKFVDYKPDGEPGLLSFGWVPKNVSESYYDVDGLLPFNMSGFADNSLLIYALALGSGTHPVPQKTWDDYVDTYTLASYGGYESVAAGALFVRQVPHAFIRFSRKRDRRIDYFLDTVNALLADRIFNMRENGYPPQVWGLNDCFGKDTYSHAAPPGPINNDGTVAPCSFAGAIPHIPTRAMEAIRYVKENYGDRVWGEYGFTSSINLLNDFISPLYVGIELGPMMLLIENYRTGLIWDLFMASPVMHRFIERAGMAGVIDDFELPMEAPPYAHWSVDRGTLAHTTTAPFHGKKALEWRGDAGKVTFSALLPENDLLDFHFNRALSIWTRNLENPACTVTIDGRAHTLQSTAVVLSGEWTHHYFAMPTTGADASLSRIVLTGTAAGEWATLDNVTLQTTVDSAAPETIDTLSGEPGPLGGTIHLSWTVPEDAGSDHVAEYVVEGIPPDGNGTEMFTVAAIKAAGNTASHMIALPENGSWSLRVAAVDTHGHRAPFSDPISVAPNPAPSKPIAYDFEDGEWTGWATSRRMTFTIVENENRGKSLRVDMEGKRSWDYITVELDPRQAALYRYIVLRVKGSLPILGKLWVSDDLQQDMAELEADDPETWTELRYDMLNANLLNTSRDQIRRLLLFPYPGKADVTDTFFIDEVRYEN
jgi:hypothetical protein